MRNLLLLLSLLLGSLPALAHATLPPDPQDPLAAAPSTVQLVESAPQPYAGALPASGVPFSHAQQPEVRLWVDGERDLFQPGEHLRLRFRTSRDAHVAILHIDPDGHIEFLFPYSPWDNDFVRGQRTYTLPSGDFNTHWRVGGAAGIGYFYIIASPQPLNYRSFQFGSRWDLSWAGGGVRGDPFWALEQLTQLLLPHWQRTPFAVDYYSYHVGRRVAYPAYVCYDRPGLWGRSVWNAYYGSCDRVVLLLRSHPHYYDARRYRGDRRVYWQQLQAPAPRHGFKERADLFDQRPGGPALRPPPVRQSPETEQRTRPAPTRAPAPTRVVPERRQEPREPVRPERQRPTLERRPPERAPAPAEPARRPVRRPDAPAPAREEPRREGRSSEPRVSPPPSSRPERQRPEG